MSGAPLGPGDEIDGFVIEGIAGRGGMGVVYRARQQRPDRLVALKVIAPDLAGDPAFRARFERESGIAAQIEHPNVIPVYALGEDGATLYIAMRFVDGTDLRSLLTSERRLDPARAAAIVDGAAQALDAAHAHGLVHRDVKPANILLATVAGRDHVYLTDFGLSRSTQSSSGLTRTGAFLGTIDYVAPEQARGERVDARADVYSLGCVLFTALTGTVPFDLDNDLAKLYAHDRRPPPSALERAPDLPAAFEEVLARAMAKMPDDRYQSAGDLGRAALAVAAGTQVPAEVRTVAEGAAAPPPPDPAAATAQFPEPATATVRPGVPEPPPPSATGSPRRRRLLVPAGIVAAVAAVAAIALSGGGEDGAGTGAGDGESTAPLAQATIAPANLTANASFESSLTGWDVFNSTFARVRAPDAPNGDYVARVALTASETAYSIDDEPDTVASSTKGTTYIAVAWVKGTASTAGKPVCLSIRERERDGGGVVSDSNAQVEADAGAYQRVRVSHVAETDGNRIDVHVYRQGPDVPPGEVFLVDAITLAEGEEIPPSTSCKI